MPAIATNPDRDPLDEEIESMLAANPGLREELQEYDLRVGRARKWGVHVLERAEAPPRPVAPPASSLRADRGGSTGALPSRATSATGGLSRPRSRRRVA